MLPQILNASNKNSLNQRFRRKRFQVLKGIIDKTKKPITILDIGGTYSYWEIMGFDTGDDIKITLLNLQKENVNHSSFQSVIGDATNLKEYEDQSFDIVFSNSVIEHLYSLENQAKMAKEVTRVGKSYYIQTPNKWFPIEPHWLVPFFQFFPFRLKLLLTKRFDLGNYKKAKTDEEAKMRISEVRLLSANELRTIFPGSTLLKEKFLFFNKSLIVLKFR